jgi:AmmeMemoRadiSam system protein B
MLVRPSAVAGAFYPADPERLSADVDRLLAQVAPSSEGRAPKALIVPHAGYVYSGIVAAHAYAQLRGQREMPLRILLFGPAHFVPLRNLALPKAVAFQTPLGSVKVESNIAADLELVPGVTRHAAAHAREHSLEVQLPFLQRALEDFRIVPLVVGDATPDAVASVMDAAWGDASTMIVVSSDLSHYLRYEDAIDVDRRTADQILALGPAPLSPEQACGCHAINGLLVAASRHHLRPKLLDLRNSGDTAGGRDEVVGYGAFAFYE